MIPEGAATEFLEFGLLGAFCLILMAVVTVLYRENRALQKEMRDAERSLVQIETARAMEGAFNRYLLGEVARRLYDGEGPGESQAAGELRGALLTYRAGIAHEIETARSEAQRDAERAEMRRAATLITLFETIETTAMVDRAQRGLGAGGQDSGAGVARDFIDRVVAGRDEAFRTIVDTILADERAEAAAAFSGLDRLRRRLAIAWAALAAALVGGGALFAVVFYRRLIQPIRIVADAAAEPGLPARVPETLPGEFAALARRFNAMGERIATEQGRLHATVAERTAALEAANEELRAIDAARRQFFANVGHELRTPLTVMLGEAQIGLASAPGGPPPPERAALERVVASARFLGRRLEDVMRLARSEDGRLALRPGRADLRDAVATAVEATRGYARANEIDLAFEPGAPDAAADWALHADAEAVTQAALALIDNAVKFTPPGGQVTVALADEGARLAFSVADTGPGFAGDPAALFDRYAQESRGRSAGGSGLGLAIVRWISEGHGGEVTAASRDGGDGAGGAVVTVRLPRGPGREEGGR
ncbi:MAG: HAMP domain-containing sensor histidine kinase, partial [Pseudomonadota bacterium]